MLLETLKNEAKSTLLLATTGSFIIEK